MLNAFIVQLRHLITASSPPSSHQLTTAIFLEIRICITMSSSVEIEGHPTLSIWHY